MQRYYQSEHANEPASYEIFSSGNFKHFLRLADEWRRQRGLVRFFYLINFSPFLSAGTTKNVYDISNQEARYRGAFVPVGPAPPPMVWGAIENVRLSRQVLFNNYGRHEHNFQAIPKAYVWDWLEMAAPIHTLGCISLNNVFLCFARGTKSALQNNPFGRDLGEPVATTQQHHAWHSKVGSWGIPTEGDLHPQMKKEL